MPLPIKYNSQESAIASYNYTDISSKTGYVTYYGFSTSGAFFLTGDSVYSREVVTEYTAASTTSGAAGHANLDLTYNNIATINGDVIVTIPFGAAADAGTNGHQIITWISGALLLISGSTTTTLGTFNTKTATAVAQVSADDDTDTIRINVSNRHIKKDDVLRLGVTTMYNSPNTASGVVGFGHDPKNRNDDSTTQIIADARDTILEIHVPYKIDL